MAEIWTMGELLAEIMRQKEDVELFDIDTFRGPFPSGAPGIFISTVARLGHSAGIIGSVGNDDFGKAIIDRMKRDRIDINNLIISDSKPTGVAFVTYFNDGSRKFLFHMGNSAAILAKAPQIESLGDDIKYFHVMGCSLTADDDFANEIINTVRALWSRNVKITFDPNIRMELINDKSKWSIIQELLKYTNIFMPGVEELLLVTGESSVETAIHKCFQNVNLEIVALKNGENGCTIYSRNEKISIGRYRVKTIDPTGAGDSFDAAFICGIAEGKSLEEAAKMAAAAGALNAGAFGPMEGDISSKNIKYMIDNSDLK